MRRKLKRRIRNRVYYKRQLLAVGYAYTYTAKRKDRDDKLSGYLLFPRSAARLSRIVA